MAKDSLKQTVYDLKSVTLDLDLHGNVTLNSDNFDKPIKIEDILKEFVGQEIDFKIGGAIKVNSDMFDSDGKDE